MRKRALLILVVPAVLLLALGALPATLGGGEVYTVTATAVEEPPTDGEANANEAIPAANLSDVRFPFTTEALESGTSEAYETGRFDLKEAFTHSPFDEFRELEVRSPGAVEEDVAWVRSDGTYYRLEITQQGDD